jgi:uncharacterized heparinase superfamily protein
MKVPEIKRIPRIFHTLRPLRWEQVFFRLKYKLSFWSKPQEFQHANITPGFDNDLSSLKDFKLSLPPLFERERILKGEFEFINLKAQIDFPPNWDDASPHKLWRYQLHYFDWIFCLDYEDAKKSVLNWIENYTFKHTRDGWEAYPTSLRLISWTLYFVAIHQEKLVKDKPFATKLSKSVQTQSAWLERSFEYHLMANHLFENAAALLIVGCLFEGKLTERWKRIGAKILDREVKEQILPDGMHFERSPMYHVRMLSVLWEATLSHNSKEFNYWETVLRTMKKALTFVKHPDGEIALFNDSNIGVYPLPLETKESCSPTTGSWKLPNAGYYGYRGSTGEYIIFDAGAIGPNYNPGHSHGDIFSYEISWNHLRMIVDTGNFDYEPGFIRNYCRSTKAHNTVEVNSKDQCDFWGTFRVGKRTEPEGVKFTGYANGFDLEGTHTGYRGMGENAVHRRKAHFSNRKNLTIKDYIQSQNSVDAVSRIHFHPDCQCLDMTDRHVVMKNADVKCMIEWDKNSVAKLEDSFYCPEFNTKLPNKVLALTQHGTDLSIQYKIRFTQG